MSERGCIKCGYILTGLPAAGTVVTCPECGLINDLAIADPIAVSTYTPYLWGTVPPALAPVVEKLCVWVGLVPPGHAPNDFGLFGVLGGMLVTGALMYWMIGREGKNSCGPRPLGARVALSACAAFAAMIIDVIVVVLVTMMLG